MTAYVMFIREEMNNKTEFDQYAQKAAKARDGHTLERLAFYGTFEVLEGNAIDGVVILKFPDMDAARQWYNSPAYQDALQHRLKAAKYQVILVNGYEE